MSAALQIVRPNDCPRPAHLVRVAVPRLNKCDWIEEYLKQIQARDYDLNWAEVIETKTLTCAEWNELMRGLLTDREWLAGKGGASSWAVQIPDDSRDGWISLSEDQRQLFRETSYLLVIKVQCAGSVIYIDPEGYNYARYVAFDAPPSLPEGKTRQELERERAKAEADARIAEMIRNIENPPAVAPDHGLRFLWNGIQTKSGKLEKCQYSRGALVHYANDTVISIYARDYHHFSDEVRACFVVTNESDSYSDYHADDTIRLGPAHPLYADVLQAFGKQEEHFRKMQAKREARWRR